jgi:hypothetical protein
MGNKPQEWYLLYQLTKSCVKWRPIYDRRPEELRAINAVDDAIAKGVIQRHQDLIIALALEYEAPRKTQ